MIAIEVKNSYMARNSIIAGGGDDAGRCLVEEMRNRRHHVYLSWMLARSISSVDDRNGSSIGSHASCPRLIVPKHYDVTVALHHLDGI